jgi:hypothetical protein
VGCLIPTDQDVCTIPLDVTPPTGPSGCTVVVPAVVSVGLAKKLKGKKHHVHWIVTTPGYEFDRNQDYGVQLSPHNATSHDLAVTWHADKHQVGQDFDLVLLDNAGEHPFTQEAFTFEVHVAPTGGTPCKATDPVIGNGLY